MAIRYDIKSDLNNLYTSGGSLPHIGLGDLVNQLVSGEVNGPGLSTENALVRWESTNGSDIIDTPDATISNTGVLNLSAENITHVLAGALQFGNTNQSADISGAGSVKYDSGILYLSDGTSWTDINSNITEWHLTGNAGTNPTTDFLGTLDAQDLIIKTDDTARIIIDKSGPVTISSNLTVSGNMTVNGTLTYINTTDLEVTDKNIVINKGGNDASSNGAGITVDRTGTEGSLVFDSTLTSNWKAGLLGSEYELLSTANTTSDLSEGLNLYFTATRAKAAVQADLDQLASDILAEESSRIAADNALDARLDILEPKVSNLENFGYDQVVYVSKNGSDTNTGKQHFPFLTITAAINAITDASPSKRYAVKVMPGSYTETSLVLKANVFIVGEGSKESIRITAPVSLGSSFNGSDDNRSGFHKVTLLSAANFDWNIVQSAAGKLYVSETVFGSTVNMNGFNNAIAQAQFNSCVIFGNITISGINVGVFTNNVCYGNITLNQHPNGGMATILAATGGYCNNLSLITTVNDFNRRCSVFLRSFWSENLTSNGPVSYADVDLVSGSKQGAQSLNGGQVVPLTPVVSHRIAPNISNTHNMGDWGKQWFWNFGYIHASTGTDLFLISYGSSFGADSSGKSIGIYTDGGGLQQNVNGGNILLQTAAVSGTGVRGNITLNGREIDVTNKKIVALAEGTNSTDAVNKSQLDTVSNNAANRFLSNLTAPTAVNVELLGISGSASAPAYSFTGRTNTGMWSSAADTLNFSTAGTERIRIDNNGDVGIGVHQLGLNTGGRLHIAQSGNLSNVRIESYNNANPNSIQFVRARGTAASPSNLLANDGIGSIFAIGRPESGATAGIEFIASQNYTSSAHGSEITFSTTANNSTSRLERLRINNSGNVGIGTVTPAQKLEITGNTKTEGLLLQSRHALTGAVTVLSNDYYIGCNSSGGAVTVTLEVATTGIRGRKLVIKAESSLASVTINAASGQTIDGLSSHVLNASYESVTLVCNGSNGWFIV